MSPKRSTLSLNQKLTLFIALLAIIVAIFTAFVSGHDWFQSPPQATAISGNVVNQTAPSAILQPQTTNFPSSVPMETFVPTPLPPEITDYRGVGMVLVPAGKFTMGIDGSYNALQPAHTVVLTSYYIDKYEVTNARYRDCVDAGVCLAPRQLNSHTRTVDTGLYFSSHEFDNYPVIYVDWSMADTYCRWREISLPTEAQWEMAAGGFDDGPPNKQTYPWKGDKINPSLANYNNPPDRKAGDTVAVGSYPLGVSPYGAYDMAGNVWEWVQDSINFSTPAYMDPSGVINPIGSPRSGYRVMRGGGWDSLDTLYLRVYFRGYFPEDTAKNNIGFRCALNVNP